MKKSQQLKENIVFEWDEHFHALSLRDFRAAWIHLERAHILAQKKPLLHTIAHFKMLSLAIRQWDGGEILGQVHRLILAAPASLLGLLPVGNVGSSRVSPYLRMDIPQDLQDILDKAK
jgi:hypothetical protein